MTHYDAQNGWTVRGKLKASAQGTAAGEAVILDSNAQLPGDLLPIVRVTGTIPASAWSGSGPYTATISLPTVSGTILPTFAPYEPNATQRTAYANARITVTAIDAQNGTVTFTADGTAPTVALPYMMTGMGGTPSGSWVSSFPGGTGSTPTTIYTLTVTVSPASSETVSGLTVQITDSQQATATEVTDSNGQAVFTVIDGETYTVQVTSTGTLQEYTTASVTIASTAETATITATAYPTISISAGSAASGCAYSIVGTGHTYSDVLDSNGQAVVTVHPGVDYTVSVTEPAHYMPLASQTVTDPQSGTNYALTFTQRAKPIVAITVVDSSGGTGYQSRNLYAQSTNDYQTGTSDSAGQSTMYLDEEDTYEIGISSIPVAYFSPVSVSQAVEADHTYNVTLTLRKKPTIVVSVVDNSGSGNVSGRTISFSPSSIDPAGPTTSSGGSTPTITLQAETTYSISSDLPSSDYIAVTPVSVAVVANQSYTATLQLDKKPVIVVTLDDGGAGAPISGVTISAELNGTAYTGVTNASGVATIQVPSAGTYAVSSAAITGYAVSTGSAVCALNGTAQVTLAVTAQSSGFKLSMAVDTTVMQTDPTGCMTYGDDLANGTPIHNVNTSLAMATNYASSSWYMKPDGTSDNPFLNECFYATFIDNGNGLEPYEKLNPNDLTQVIAVYDGNGGWVDSTGTSHITTHNTMFCIPTVYDTAGASIVISSSSSDGTAKAHTIGGHVHQYLALGVYLISYDSSSKAQSISGVQAKGSQTRAQFRAAATTVSVKNGYSMLWNFYHWRLWRLLAYMSCGSFACQQRIGQGGHSYSTRQTGATNTMGPFAGNVSGTSDHMKCFLEDIWGCQYLFVDDVYNDGTGAWIGQNAVPDDAKTGQTKFNIFQGSAGGFPKTMQVTDVEWGFGLDNAGTKDVGLCDYMYTTSTTSPVLRVCGYSVNVSDGYAGPAYVDRAALTNSSAYSGSRLAFVFDL